MHSIDRRDFVRRSAAAAAGLAATPMLAPFFAQDPQPEARQGSKPAPREEQLRAALQRSKEQGKPLLVLVVPEDAKAAYARGQQFGALLNHGGPLALLEIALCVPACATIAELRRATAAPANAGEPWLLLVDPAAAAAEPPQLKPIDAVVDEPPSFFGNKLPFEEFLRVEQQCIEANNEQLVTGLHRALHRGGDSLTRLADRVRAALPAAQQRALAGWLGGGAVPDDELLVRATAAVRAAAGKQPDAGRAATLAVLGGAIERVLIGRRVPGSKWASTRGCGAIVEEPDAEDRGMQGPCGTGHVPDLSRRFLQFLTGS